MHRTNPPGKPERIFPVSLAKENVDSHPQDGELVLELHVELIQMLERFVQHPKLRVTLRHADYLIERHRP
jgi:hypothetical protein